MVLLLWHPWYITHVYTDLVFLFIVQYTGPCIVYSANMLYHDIYIAILFDLVECSYVSYSQYNV